ncbi:hypothetical protein UFOVP488_16 [uncultured Caudovirales phage]|uniref:Uncharacterized protein n=1 Tax=uncultured Caudovirales phage TaxID=2100421 RepID=A0A6J5MH40_9CAUD|nr:hypothetical protein UFOVP488_16 [uncultured Caudovirales phage]CAB4180017.1 hypothetical protein UFOVP1048_13 [uncultured Caudovirales phage]CAB4221936.1 hypothetical protein UFOVP1658_9 [uncultured Caudovirales phage]
MKSTITIEVYGVKAALKEVNKINPKLRREFTKRYKNIVKPVIQQAKQSFPDEPPLSRMGKPFKHLGSWDGGLVAKGVTAKINTRSARKRNIEKGAVYESIATFLIQQKTGWGSLYDMAGKKNSSSIMARNLETKGFGVASRAMWPAYEAQKTEIDIAILALCKDVMNEVDRNLGFNDGN